MKRLTMPLHFNVKLTPLLLILLVTWGLPVWGQMFMHEEGAKVTPWQLVREEDSIETYNRMVEGLSLKEFKVTTVINRPLAIVVYHLNDYRNFNKWMSKSMYDFVILPSGEKQSYLLYFKLKTPFFTSDRDAVVKVEVSTMGKGYIIRMKAQPEQVPVGETFVRITRWDVAWVLESVDDTHVRVTYMGTVEDPQKLPDNFAEELMARVPFECMQGLRNIVHSTQ